MEPTQSTFHSIQMLRGLAALLVVLFHAHGAFYQAGSDLIVVHERYLFAFGAVGVHVFFVISGFIMIAASQFEPAFDSISFLKRRFIRVYPVYWVSAALFVSYHSFVGIPYNLSWGELGGALFLWPGNAASIIGPAWTLSYEMFFYACFALTMGLGPNRGFFLLASGFCSLVLLGFLFQPESSFFRLATDSLLLEFVAGMGIGWLLRKKLLPEWGGGLWLALSLILFACGLAYGYHRMPSALMWGMPSALLVLGAVCLECRWGSAKVVQRIGILGESSYSLYILHILIITVALLFSQQMAVVTGSKAFICAIVVSLACVGIAELFHRKIERPLLRRLKPRRALAPSRTH